MSARPAAYAAATAPVAIHASAVVIGEAAIVLRGPSGAGKSTLALALIDAATARGLFASLVADDRTLLRLSGGRLIVAPHMLIAGQVERRFVGLATMAHEAAAVARLVVDLVLSDPQCPAVRLPAKQAAQNSLLGVVLPHLQLPAGHAGAVEAILHRLRELAS